MVTMLMLAALLGLIPAKIAHNKGHSFIGFWIFGFLLLIVAIPVSIVMQKDQAVLDQRRRAGGEKQCSHCASWIGSAAIICPVCKHEEVAVIPPPGEAPIWTPSRGFISALDK